MTDTDEKLLTAAKLAEQARGDLDGDPRLLDHAGAVGDAHDRSVLSFLGDVDSFQGSALSTVVESALFTDNVTEALRQGDHATVSQFVGVTEQDLDGSTLTLPLRVLNKLENHDAPAFLAAAGNPNTGKTNLVATLVELRRLDLDRRGYDPLVISNLRSWDLTDRLVTSMHDLAVALLENRMCPKLVVIDEGSTHFDARTYRREIAQQYTPVAKRYAKLHVDTEAVICHTGKDLHPERKALTTLAVWKLSKTEAEFFSEWKREAGAPSGQLFSGAIDSLERAGGYDPDDSAPWDWNLRADLFADDLDWPDLLDRLHDLGPTE